MAEHKAKKEQKRQNILNQVAVEDQPAFNHKDPPVEEGLYQ